MKSEQMYIKKPVVKLTGKETFKNTETKKFSVLEFWQYGFSNLNSNVMRGVLAEFIVESALKNNMEIETRSPWGNYDVFYLGKKIEVKCSAYIQDWDQNKLTTIRWSGLKAKDLYYSEAVAKKSILNKNRDYKADIYILAFVHHAETNTLDVMDMNQWSFFILSKKEIWDITNDGNSISLAKLIKLGHKPVCFDQLPSNIRGFCVK